MKIDLSKKYTSGGKPVELLHRAPEGWPEKYPWRGIVEGSEQTWTDEGRFRIDGPQPDYDLIEVREPRVLFVNEYKSGSCHAYDDEKRARRVAGTKALRVAVRYVEDMGKEGGQ